MKDTQNNKEENRKVTSVMRGTLIGVFIVILVFCGLLIARLVYLNNVDGDKYAKAVLSQQAYTKSTIKSMRGRILDRNGVVLARSEKMYNVIIDPGVILSEWYYLEPTLEAVEKILGYDPEAIRKVINQNSKSSYVIYEKDIDYSLVSEFNSYKASHKFVVGIWFEEENRRVYPYSSLASHVIGFTNASGEGSYGLEEYYDEQLTGTDGLTAGYFDSELNSRKIVKDAIDGNEIVSTIDYNIQTVIEQKVSEFVNETGCNNIGVIVLDPNRGEVLGMASNVEYDLNDPRNLTCLYDEDVIDSMTEQEKLDARYKLWRNFCVCDTYEPGSTYKTITVASALEEDTVLTNDTFECIGYKEVGGWHIGCNNKYGHGEITLAQALMKSCNCALMDIAEKLGPDNFFKYQARFGFGTKTGIDIPGETDGIVIKRKNLNVTELATSSFGTTFNVTMIQMAAAYGSIINGGTYYRPHLVKEIRTAEGVTVNEIAPEALRRTVSGPTSEFIRNALYMTVEGGTATPAKLDGYIVGGKTGTAQKRPREDKKYVVSFVGFAPVANPQVMLYIVIDEIHDESLSGSSTPATKMSAAIMKEILPYLGLYPDGEIEYNIDISLIDKSDDDTYDETQDEMNPDVLPDDFN